MIFKKLLGGTFLRTTVQYKEPAFRARFLELKMLSLRRGIAFWCGLSPGVGEEPGFYMVHGETERKGGRGREE
jgi:hypothetical protein